MDEIEVYNQLSAIATPTFAVTFGDDSDQAIRIAEHKAWLGSIRRERPGTNTPYKVGIYIRYFNQTKYACSGAPRVSRENCQLRRSISEQL